jgi:hypothetical protein
MGGLLTMGSIGKVSQSKNLLRVLMVMMALLMNLPLAVQACNLDTDAGDDKPGPGGSMFRVIGHSFEGNLLVITYDIEYPGMTKVKLFNGNNELLWRSQRVDDENGTHQLKVKASSLDPGNYVFEFDYKNQIERHPVPVSN